MYDPITVARFWSKVEVKKSVLDCWLWRGAKRNKYGHMKIKGDSHQANRIAWEIFHGKSLGQKLALHHCDNYLCCNPRHIYGGTRKQNWADYKEKMYADAGVGRVKRNKGQRLTKADKDYLVKQSQKGEKVSALAEQFGIPYSTAHSIVRRHAV